ncbi:MAG: hypothetical protein IIW23_00305, partial [Clostridia bacterium]|nr:hypothetical protein [Clostridia bacterium]
GMKFVGWANVDVPGAAIYPIYEKTSDRFTISATEGTVTYAAGQDYALFNDRIVVEAPTTNAEGEAFAYWTANGDIFSYSNRISFLAFGNANFVPVYGDAEVAPIVFTDSVATIVAGTEEGKYKMQVMGAVQVPEDVTVKEIGILLSASAMDAAQMKAGYEANDGTVKKLVASNAVAGKQFTYGINNIAAGKTRTALTYAILSDGTVVYGNTTCVATMPSAN